MDTGAVQAAKGGIKWPLLWWHLHISGGVHFSQIAENEGQARVRFAKYKRERKVFGSGGVEAVVKERFARIFRVAVLLPVITGDTFNDTMGQNRSDAVLNTNFTNLHAFKNR